MNDEPVQPEETDAPPAPSASTEPPATEAAPETPAAPPPTLRERYHEVMMPNYAPGAFYVKGKGAWLWDDGRSLS